MLWAPSIGAQPVIVNIHASIPTKRGVISFNFILFVENVDRLLSRWKWECKANMGWLARPCHAPNNWWMINSGK
ncbi:MAG TPA: hypothetical protein VMX97_11710 [Hyphomicrobiaceae bacterium]|nr:hypothetical protein [Hyphomicrobiaceae bacterium]